MSKDPILQKVKELEKLNNKWAKQNKQVKKLNVKPYFYTMEKGYEVRLRFNSEEVALVNYLYSKKSHTGYLKRLIAEDMVKKRVI